MSFSSGGLKTPSLLNVNEINMLLSGLKEWCYRLHVKRISFHHVSHPSFQDCSLNIEVVVLVVDRCGGVVPTLVPVSDHLNVFLPQFLPCDRERVHPRPHI